MLDAFIIEDVKKRERERRERDDLREQPVIPLPSTIPYVPEREDEDPAPVGGMIIIDYGASAQYDNKAQRRSFS